MQQLKFYTYPSCTSCRRTKAWLKSEGISFREQHLFRDTPTYEELVEILKMTTSGIDEILATRSKTFKALNINVEELTLSECISLLQKEPKLLKRPIVTDGKRLVVGYNMDALKKFSKSDLHMKVS